MQVAAKKNGQPVGQVGASELAYLLESATAYMRGEKLPRDLDGMMREMVVVLVRLADANGDEAISMQEGRLIGIPGPALAQVSEVVG